MASGRRLLGVLVAVWAGVAGAQNTSRAPHIGYFYPAGGRQGTTFEVYCGGQYLNGVKVVRISGKGVQAKVVEHVRPLNNQQLADIGVHLREQVRRRLTDAASTGLQAANPAAQGKPPAEMPALPDHPWVRDLDRKSLRELEELRWKLYVPKKQPNAQIGEMVRLEVAIEPTAAPGNREVRLDVPAGLTNPLWFQVGHLPEALEVEQFGPKPPPPTPLDLPVVLNGQILPGDVDRFRIRAKAGQRLVIQAFARQLVPYLADAVPGWFQATMGLYDSRGQELAYADDYSFDPDPVLFYAIPADGDYDLEIRDSIYRGREDFVYRVVVGELPFITAMFPLGGPSGYPTVAGIVGWNLPQDRVTLDTTPGPDTVRQSAVRWQNGALSNVVRFAVDTLPEADEVEPNNAAAQAQKVALPLIVNGQIPAPGDVDCFQLEGQAGDTIVAEVMARRINSPLDSLLRLLNAKGEVVAVSDDHPFKDSGLLTHDADSYLRVKLPASGVYCVELSDTLRQGGPSFAYRLRLSHPQPSFSLRSTPATINCPTAASVPITVHAVRKDGFDGDIMISIADSDAGMALSGGWVPEGRDSCRISLIGPPRRLDEPVVMLKLVGRAEIGGQTVTRPVMPAEDMMQAFAYRHLVPAQQRVVVTGKGPGVPAVVQLPGGRPIYVPVGGTGRVGIRTTSLGKLEGIRFELSEPPKGVSLGPASAVEGGLFLEINADAAAAKPGLSDNLIVEVYRESQGPPKADGQPGPIRRSFAGWLPAIPIRCISR